MGGDGRVGYLGLGLLSLGPVVSGTIWLQKIFKVRQTAKDGTADRAVSSLGSVIVVSFCPPPLPEYGYEMEGDLWIYFGGDSRGRPFGPSM